MKVPRKRYHKVLSGVLVVTLLAGTVMSSSMKTQAKETLPGIEKLVSSNDEKNMYHIMEIVPDMKTAEIGYYFKGQEPIKWKDEMSKFFSKEERLAYLESLYQPESKTGLLASITSVNNTDAMPLWFTPYQEKTSLTLEEQNSKEWDALDYTANPTVENIKGYYTLKLNAEGKVEENGDYSKTSKNAAYAKADPIENGNYIENIQHYIYSDNFTGDYDVAFQYDESDGSYNAIGTLVDINDEKLPDSTYLYTMNDSGRYVFAGSKAELLADGRGDGSVGLYRVEFVKKDTATGILYSVLKTTYNPSAGQFVAQVDPKRPYLEVPMGQGYLVCVHEEEVTYEFTPGTGRYTFVADDKYPSELVKIGHIYFKGGFVNKQWFKRHVLDMDDDKVDRFYETIHTVDPYTLQNLEISKMNMVYLSAGNNTLAQDKDTAGYEDDNDISWEKAVQLLTYILNNGIPTIVDASILDNEDSKNTNLGKLTAILMQTDIAEFYRNNAISETNEPSWEVLMEGLKVDGDSNYVNNHVYVRKGQGLVNATFTHVFDEATLLDGFKVVRDEIIAENFYRENATGKTYEKLPEDVSQAVAVKYILNYANKRPVVYKSEIRILEVQPRNSFDLTEEKVKEKLGASGETQLQGSTITIDQMSIAEFIGKIDDLNAKYDMIYFGMNTRLMNVDASGNTIYNDKDMDGLVYAHVGDRINCTTSLAGLLDIDYVDSNPNNYIFRSEWFAGQSATNKEFKITKNARNAGDYAFPAGSTTITKNISYDNLYSYRYSDNDLTKEKLVDLQEFLRAGYPVVLADGFFTNTTASDGSSAVDVNTQKVDTASYLYQFVKGAVDEGRKNLISYSNMGTSLFATYLNLPKLNINLTELPNTDENNITKLYPVSGAYSLDFDFTIYNIAAVSQVTTRYDCKLFIDVNADGKYSAMKEEIDDIQIIRNSDKTVMTPVTVEKDGTTIKQYQLEPAVSYHLKRRVPDGYKGVLPWKIEVSQTDNSYIRNQVGGYMRLMTSEREEIRVLQIGNAGGNNLNITNDAYFTKWFKMVEDFNVVAEFKASNEFANTYNPGDLDKYNMLILGFADVYKDISNHRGAVDAILNFMKSGKSVLFTHDTTSFVNLDKSVDREQDTNGTTYDVLSGDANWGYNINKILRDRVGMDRYGVTSEELPFLRKGLPIQKSDTEKWNALLASGRDIAIAPRSDLTSSDVKTVREVQGYTYNILNYKMINKGSTLKNIKGIDTGQGLYGQSWIRQINEGQITTYPFKLEKQFLAASTHSQYYQLDLAADGDGDGESDIVVWYTLESGRIAGAADMYKLGSGDVRNNYYIYNKGNITYSGVGHSKIDNDEEAKLFINTMIAAYSAGYKDPTVAALESKDVNSREVNNYYVAFDGSIGSGEIIDETQSIYYYASDNNFVSGKKWIDVKYYYEDPRNGTKEIDGVKVSPLNVETMNATTGGKLSGTVNAQNELVTQIDGNLPYQIEVPLHVFNGNTGSMRVFVSIQSHIQSYDQIWHSSDVVKTINFVKSELFALD